MSELELKSVSYQYKGNRRNVLDHVSCAFDKGEVTAVIGPSGSGKTTLLSLMAGLDEPTGGSLWVQGQNMEQMDLDAYRRQKASVIFQAFQLFPRLTVLENVCYPMELNGISKKKAKLHALKNLEAVGIGQENISVSRPAYRAESSSVSQSRGHFHPVQESFLRMSRRAI